MMDRRALMTISKNTDTVKARHIPSPTSVEPTKDVQIDNPDTINDFDPVQEQSSPFDFVRSTPSASLRPKLVSNSALSVSLDPHAYASYIICQTVYRT